MANLLYIRIIKLKENNKNKEQRSAGEFCILSGFADHSCRFFFSICIFAAVYKVYRTKKTVSVRVKEKLAPRSTRTLRQVWILLIKFSIHQQYRFKKIIFRRGYQGVPRARPNVIILRIRPFRIKSALPD